jgi:hypothetical protein
MEMLEGMVWIMTGFISAAVSMEVACRLAKGQAKSASVNKLIPMTQDTRTK